MDSRGERGSNMALLLYCALICLFSVSALLLTSAHPGEKDSTFMASRDLSIIACLASV